MYFFLIFFIVVDLVIHWNETAMGLHVFPIPIPPPINKRFEKARQGKANDSERVHLVEWGKKVKGGQGREQLQ